MVRRQSAGMEVELLGRRELPAAFADWERLHGLDESATPFTSVGWARAWLDEWEPEAEPWLLSVRDAGAVVGIAPFAIVRRGPLRWLQMIGREPGDYWDVLAEPSDRGRVVSAVGEALVNHRRAWDVAMLSCLPPESLTLPVFARAGLGLLARKPVKSPAIDLPGTFEDYLRSLPSRRRQNLRRHLRRLDDGEVTLRDIREPAEFPDTIARWQQLRIRQWEAVGKTMTPVQQTERFQRFMLAVVQQLVPAGFAQVWEIATDERLVGSFINVVDPRSYYWYLGGFEPDTADLGVGKIAIAASIRISIESGRRRYDFTRGDEPYKYWYGASDRILVSAVMGNSRPRSRAALGLARAVKAYRGARAG